MKLSPEEIQEEAFQEGEEYSVLTTAASCGLSVASIARLCDAIVINAKDKDLDTAIMAAADSGEYDSVDYLAMTKAESTSMAMMFTPSSRQILL
jgi:chemotaxis methyl-accepting protein methylase